MCIVIVLCGVTVSVATVYACVTCEAENLLSMCTCEAENLLSMYRLSRSAGQSNGARPALLALSGWNVIIIMSEDRQKQFPIGRQK